MPNRLVLIHGYSDAGKSFAPWRDKLAGGNPAWDPKTISTCTYQSLTDEVTIKDLADGLERALRSELEDGEPFDAIVHSTGMLVLREWLTRDRARLQRLKHLIGLAPATFGSPLAKKGRSWLGAVFKGSKHLGPDFLAAGDGILDGLELASAYSWQLAARDIFADPPFYDGKPDTPYVFIFCGTDTYGGLRQLTNSPGLDGTVRWAGAGFNTRKVVLDLTRATRKPVDIESWMATNVPVHLMQGMNHGTILSAPTDELVGLVKRALAVNDDAGFRAWLAQADAHARGRKASADLTEGAWQQLIVRCVDQRGDPIHDYHLQLGDGADIVEAFDDERVEVYSGDASYRCFHFDAAKLLRSKTLTLRIMALSGSTWVDYQGFGWEQAGASPPSPTAGERWDATFDLTEILLRDKAALQKIGAAAGAFDNERLLAPFTTTLVEIRLDRDAYPLDLAQISKLLTWDRS